MISGWISDWASHMRERLTNPVLGPFSIGWLIWNWRLVAILAFSRQRIEERIQQIDETYLNVWDVLVIPAAFAIVYALAIPWMNLFVQELQERANTRRRKNRLKHETDVLQASVERAEAQAALNRILAQDEITRRQQEEIDSMKQRLESQRQEAESRITAAQAEFEAKRQDYQEQSNKSTAEARRMKKELKSLEEQLAKEKAEARFEAERMLGDIEKKRKGLNFHLRSQVHLSDTDLTKLLVRKRYRLYHNPRVGPERSKTVTFSTSGDVKEGANANEHKWRISNGLLEFLQKDGKVHSRFQFLPESQIFVHDGDPNTTSARGQFMIPEPKPEPSAK